jgi:hypothetical protein
MKKNQFFQNIVNSLALLARKKRASSSQRPLMDLSASVKRGDIVAIQNSLAQNLNSLSETDPDGVTALHCIMLNLFH